MAYTLSTLRTYTRDLTGIYTTDIISDDLLSRWINEAYFEVTRIHKWSWSGSVTTLGNSDSPAFPEQFHQVLAYRAAIKVLQFESDDTKRSEFFMSEYNVLVADMYKDDLQAFAYAETDTMAGLISNVRTWLDDYSDRISDYLIEEKIMDAYDELYEGATWSFSKTPFPGMGWPYTRVLVFAAAGRLAGLAGKPADFVAAMQTEFGLAMEELKTVFLLTNTAVTGGNRFMLRNMVRSVTGIYSKNVPDSIINAWLNEEYQMLVQERSWKWAEQVHQVELPTGTSTFSFPGGFAGHVLEMFAVEKVSGSVGSQDNVSSNDIVYTVPSVLDVEENSSRYVYTMQSPTTVRISPAPSKDITVRIRYVITPVELTTDASISIVPYKYSPIIAYRVGMRIAAYSGAPSNIIDLCQASSSNLYNAMYSEYMISHSTEPLQMGGSGLATRKYLPWFRTA
jgi:hypothetical protein